MGHSVRVDTRDVKQILNANKAIAQSLRNLFSIVGELPADPQAKVRIELDSMLDQVQKIVTSVQTAVSEND